MSVLTCQVSAKSAVACSDLELSSAGVTETGRSLRPCRRCPSGSRAGGRAGRAVEVAREHGSHTFPAVLPDSRDPALS